MNTKETLKAIFQKNSHLSPREIENYLADKSSAEERFRIENQLLDDPLAADAVEGFGLSKSAVPDFSFDDFLKKVDAAPEAQTAKTVQMPARRFTLRRVAAAAAVIVAAGLGLFFWSNNDQRLYTQFHERYESDALLALRDDSSANVAEVELIAGLEAYDVDDFDKCIGHLKNFLKKNPNSQEALFYSGLSYLEKDELVVATEYLMKARTFGSDYYREATWYAALSHLKKENTAAAKRLLEDLLEKEGRYYQKARVLDSKL